MRVNVTIEHGEEELYGEFSGPKTSRNVPKIVGNAVLNALADMILHFPSMTLPKFIS